MSGKAMMDRGDGVPAGLRESTRASLDESERLARDWCGQRRRAHRVRVGAAVHPVVQRGARSRDRRRGPRAARTRSSTRTPPSTPPSERPCAPSSGTTTWPCCAAGASPDRAPCSPTASSSSLDEARQMATDGTRIVHCPSANLKLGSGIARVAELDGLGVQLALGADGAPCNNNLDAWTELRHAALLAKVRTGVTTLPARRALRLATIDGARALGLDALIGSIEPGKRADLVVVRLDGAHVEPGGDVFSRLVYACGARDVVARADRRRARRRGPRAPAPGRRAGQGSRAGAGAQAERARGPVTGPVPDREVVPCGSHGLRESAVPSASSICDERHRHRVLRALERLPVALPLGVAPSRRGTTRPRASAASRRAPAACSRARPRAPRCGRWPPFSLPQARRAQP